MRWIVLFVGGTGSAWAEWLGARAVLDEGAVLW